MRWPWVSRRAYDLSVRMLEELRHRYDVTVQSYDRERTRLTEELDRLADQNAQLIEHLKRMDRVEHGLGETPRQLKQPEPMPRALVDHIRAYAGRSTQKMMRDQAYRRHARGESWESIMREALPEDEDATATETR
jgi:hypothetical protein